MILKPYYYHRHKKRLGSLYPIHDLFPNPYTEYPMSKLTKEGKAIFQDMLEQAAASIISKHDTEFFKKILHFARAVPERSHNRDAIVLFTGGVDSTTALLWAVLCGNYSSITALSVRSEKKQITTLIDIDSAGQVFQIIKEHFPEECARSGLKHDIMTIDNTQECRFYRETPLDRPAAQIPDSPMVPAMIASMMVIREGTDIIDGYCLGENYWPIRHDLEGAAELIFKYKNSPRSQFLHPLLYMTRGDILFALLRSVPELLTAVAYCPPHRFVDGNNCGVCAKCMDTMHAVESPFYRSHKGWRDVLSEDEKKALIGDVSEQMVEDASGRTCDQCDHYTEDEGSPFCEYEDELIPSDKEACSSYVRKQSTDRYRIFDAIRNITMMNYLLNRKIKPSSRWNISPIYYNLSRKEKDLP